MAPTAATKKHPNGRKTTQTFNNRIDCLAMFRQRAKALMPAPRSRAKPEDGEFISRITRHTEDGYVHIIQIEQTPPTEACEEPMLAVVDYEGLQELFEAEPRRRSGPKTRSSTRRSTVAEETGDDSEEWRPHARSTTPRPTRTRTGTKSQTSGTSRSNVSTRRTTKTSQAARAHQQQEDELCGMMDDFDIVSNVGGPVPSESSASTRVSAEPPRPLPS